MRQYKFIEPTQSPLSTWTGVETIIDGINLDRTIEGFQTLTVQGRELVGRDLESRNYKTIRAGKKTQTARNYRQSLAPNVLISSTMTSRTIVVRFEIKAKSDGIFRRIWERLNLLVNKEEVSIIFSDDPDYYYTGTLTQIEEVNPGSNHIHSSFQYECMDPFKYRIRPQTLQFLTSASFPVVADYPVIIEEIRIKPRDTASTNLRITNQTTGSFLQIDRQTLANTEIVIDLLTPDVRTAAGLDRMADLNLFSDLEDFSVELGDIVQTNVAADVWISYRRRML